MTNTIFDNLSHGRAIHNGEVISYSTTADSSVAGYCKKLMFTNGDNIIVSDSCDKLGVVYYYTDEAEMINIAVPLSVDEPEPEIVSIEDCCEGLSSSSLLDLVGPEDIGFCLTILRSPTAMFRYIQSEGTIDNARKKFLTDFGFIIRDGS